MTTTKTEKLDRLVVKRRKLAARTPEYLHIAEAAVRRYDRARRAGSSAEIDAARHEMLEYGARLDAHMQHVRDLSTAIMQAATEPLF